MQSTFNSGSFHSRMQKSRWLFAGPATFRLMGTCGVITTIFLLSLALGTSLVEAKNQKDGKFAKTLDEYHSTIKCMLNIAEETLPGIYLICSSSDLWRGS